MTQKRSLMSRLLTCTLSIHGTFLIVLNIIFWCTTSGKILNESGSMSTESYHNTTLSYSSSERCQQFYGNLTAQEIARFVDASGKPASGIYGGNTLWYGSYSECQKLSNSRYCWTVFPGNISLVKNELSYIEWGVCVPDVCSREDVLNNMEFLFKKVSDINTVTPITTFVQVKCAEDPEYTTSVIITMIFCAFLVGVCLLATLLEVLKVSYKPDREKTNENNGHIPMDKDANEKTPLLPEVTAKVEKDQGLFYQIIKSFSMVRNIKSVMSTNVGKSDLTYLHGIRVLTLFWIILFHVNMSMFNGFWPYDNPKDVMRFTTRLTPIVLYTAYGVDTFFVLSGLLVMYTNMNKKVKSNGQTNWFKYYFHRFWRLTPVYMFCLLFLEKFQPFFGAGPIWFAAADTSACSKNWWTNVLYVNNFVHLGKFVNEICMIHTWYLSADMQMFVISPIFLLIAYRYRLRRLVYFAGVTLLSSIIVTACLAAKDDSPPLSFPYTRLNTFWNNHVEEQFEIEYLSETFKDIYLKPYCRIQPYIVGMVLGYVLYEHFSKKFRFPWKFVGLMWISAIALALTVVYAPYSALKEDPHVWTKGERVLFWSLKWFIWGLCIVWLIFACHYNFAGFIKTFLEAKFWIPLSHINYAAYLVHVSVIMVLSYNIESPIHYTWFTMVTYFLSSLVLTYAIAFIIVVVVEMPFANLEALAWKKWENK